MYLVKLISIYQIIGAIVCLCYLPMLGLDLILDSTMTVLVFGFLFFVCMLSVVGGIKLYKEKTSGWSISILVQLIQLPYFGIGYVTYYMGLGLPIFIGFDNFVVGSNSKFIFNTEFIVGIHYIIEIANELERTFIGINVTALIILILLLKLRTKYL